MRARVASLGPAAAAARAAAACQAGCAGAACSRCLTASCTLTPCLRTALRRPRVPRLHAWRQARARQPAAARNLPGLRPSLRGWRQRRVRAAGRRRRCPQAGRRGAGAGGRRAGADAGSRAWRDRQWRRRWRSANAGGCGRCRGRCRGGASCICGADRGWASVHGARSDRRRVTDLHLCAAHVRHAGRVPSDQPGYRRPRQALRRGLVHCVPGERATWWGPWFVGCTASGGAWPQPGGQQAGVQAALPGRTASAPTLTMLRTPGARRRCACRLRASRGACAARARAAPTAW